MGKKCYIVQNTIDNEFLSAFDSKEKAENFKSEYETKSGYYDEIKVITVPCNVQVSEICRPTKYSITVQQYKEQTYEIEAFNQEEAEEKAYAQFAIEEDELDYYTEITDMYEMGGY